MDYRLANRKRKLNSNRQHAKFVFRRTEISEVTNLFQLYPGHIYAWFYSDNPMRNCRSTKYGAARKPSNFGSTFNHHASQPQRST